MDTLNLDRNIVENTLMEYTRIPYAYDEIQTEAIFDRDHDRYVLINVGWDQGRRVHGSLVHKAGRYTPLRAKLVCCRADQNPQ